MARITANIIAAIILLLPLTACESMPEWIGGGEESAPLPGERISVLSYKTALAVTNTHENITIKLPNKTVNKEWHFQGIPPAENLSLSKKLDNNITVNIGEEAEDDLRMTSSPIIAEGKIFILDGAGDIIARNVDNIKEEIWRVSVENNLEMEKDFFGLGLSFGSGKDKKVFLGGNISYNRGNIFVTTGRGIVAALSSKDGKILWQRSVKIPIRSAPIANNDKVFFITSSNQTYALDVNTGKTIWTHAGVHEVTSIYGSPSPIISGESVITPYSSGELYSLSEEDGKVLWSDLLSSRANKYTSLISMNDINAIPVISKGKLYAVSSDGVLTAYNIASGDKIWRQEISALKTPWVAGNALFVLTTDNELVAVHASDGRIKWVTELYSYSKSFMKFGSGKGDKIDWNGPILADGQLFINGSHGKMFIASAYSGTLVQEVNTIKDSYLPPIIVDNKIYILNNEAELMTIY